MKKRNDELKMMFFSFAGGYILGKSGILDDPALGKVIGKALKVWIDGNKNTKSEQPEN